MLYATIFHSKKKPYLQQLKEEEGTKKIRIFVNPEHSIRFYHDAKKMIKILKRNKIKFVVLSEELFENQILNEQLKENNVYAITGFRLFRALLPFVVEDICHQMRFPIEKIRILLYTNEYSIENRELIQLLSQNVKQLTVVSRQYQKYQREVFSLYEQYGITIKLYGEEAYFYQKEQLIINLNREENELQKNLFHPDVIYLSFLNHFSEIPSYWNGIVISDFIIRGTDMAEESIRQLALCEAKIYEVLKPLKENEEIFFDKQYQITGYWGKNGKITDENFLKIGKSFT